MDGYTISQIVQIGTSPGILAGIIRRRLSYSFAFTDCMKVRLQGLGKTMLVTIDSPSQRCPITTILNCKELHLKNYG